MNDYSEESLHFHATISQKLCVPADWDLRAWGKVCIRIPEIFFKRKCSVLIFLFLLLLTKKQHGVASMVILRLPEKWVSQREKQDRRSLDCWPAFHKNDFQSCVITSKIFITCLTSYLWESHSHHESNMHGIKVLLTEIGVRGDLMLVHRRIIIILILLVSKRGKIYCHFLLLSYLP